MPQQSRIRVAVSPATEYQRRRPLFDMLQAALGIDFEPYVYERIAAISGLISYPDAETSSLNEALPDNLSSYQIKSANTAVPKGAGIAFSSSSRLHVAFRNNTFTDSTLEYFSGVPGGEVLATVDGHPIWKVERKGDRETHVVGIDLPEFSKQDVFHSHFYAGRWFAMVPMLHFLRALLQPDGWPASQPRATFIIDDPNLHSNSYGYLDFEALIRSAAAHNYHATIATVPLDSWYFDPKVAALFRNNRKYISLMMHGVNHVADELARNYAQRDALALLASGLKRISKFEAQTGLHVARIMAAPHGAFAESIADTMAELGFESACVSAGSLLRWNPDKPWAADMGFPVGQALGCSALPVFHRIAISEIELALSAFLGHPILIATHHQDCAANLARLEFLADRINELPGMQWMGIEEISRSNYLYRSESNLLHIWPHSRRFTITIPPEVTAIEVHDSPYSEGFFIDLPADHGNCAAHQETHAPESFSIRGNRVDITLAFGHHLDFQGVASRPVGLWPIVRRLLTEARDRTKPLVSPISGR